MAYTVTKAGGETLRAVATGFYAGRRVRQGEAFHAAEGLTFPWAVPLSARTLNDDAVGEDGLLGKAIKDILPVLPTLGDADLRALRDTEAGGQGRKSLLGAIDDEIANRVGKEDGEPDPLS